MAERNANCNRIENTRQKSIFPRMIFPAQWKCVSILGNPAIIGPQQLMPLRELKNGKQVADWLAELAAALRHSGEMTLIGSAGLLWHAHDRGLTIELPEASMDVDPVTESDEVARLCYEGLIGSEFERTHGWHINLMPHSVLRELPSGWEQRAATRNIGLLRLTAPSPADLLAPKLRRNEPRDRAQAEWARNAGLLD